MTKRYEVWVDCNHAKSTPATMVLEFSDDATEEVIEAECKDVCDDLIGSNFDTGWRELEPGELSTEEKHRGVKR